jgi:hypothetical protein
MLWIINAANEVLYPIRHRQGINVYGSSPFVIGLFLSCMMTAVVGGPRYE